MVSIRIPERVLAGATRLSEALRRAIWAYSIGLGAVLTTLLVAQVVMRYAFSQSLGWVNELSQYLAIWIFLPLAAVLIVEDDHIEISMVVDRFPDRAKRLLSIVELLSLLAFSAVFGYAGWNYATESGFRSVSPSLGVDMFWIYVVLPISGALMAYFSLIRLLHVVDDADRAYDLANDEGGIVD